MRTANPISAFRPPADCRLCLADYLDGKHFFLYGKFPNNERRQLTRYITAFNG